MVDTRPKDISLCRAGISLKVTLHPFSIAVSRNGIPLLKRLSSEYDLERLSVRRSFRPETASTNGNYLVLEDRAVAVRMKIELLEGLVRISWSSDKPLNVIDAWRSVGGEWYGQGELRHQVYPLNEHFIAGTPYALKGEEFLARRIQPPIWINRRGFALLIDSYEIFEARFFGDGLIIKAIGIQEFTYHIVVGRDIRDCRKTLLKRVGLPRRIPDVRILTKPIFSTWAFFKKDIDQDKVLVFAKEIHEHEFPCSVIEIDDKWEKEYGDHDFDPSRFPQPKDLVSEIHKLGYAVTLWVHPFINYESKNYEYAASRGYLIRDPEEDRPAKVRWWNGEGGLVDISNPEARAWLNGELTRLKREYGIDGFKFDDGDATFIPLSRKDSRVLVGRTYAGLKPNQYTDEWIRFVAENHYDLAEVRTGFLAQRYGVVTREGDKESVWGLDGGLHATITQALTLSLTGYPYIMPDMIGGNEYRFRCDKELFIRWVEADIMMPVVQYSIPPWRFDDETVEIAKAYTRFRMELGEYYVRLARKAADDGEPIVTPLVLWDPEDERAAWVNDEYLIGNLLVAPIVERGKDEREIYLPKGLWEDIWSGRRIKGPAKIRVEAPLRRLPLYVEVHDRHLYNLLRRARKHLDEIA